MNTEHKITYQDKSMCCHDDLIESNFGTLEGFKDHFATEWGCTVEDLSYELIDLAPIEAQKQIAAEWHKADAFQRAMFDDNCQRSVGRIERKLMQLGIYDSPDAAVMRDMIDRYDAALIGLVEDGCLWDQYAANRASILAGQEPTPYTWPDGLPTIHEITAEARRVIRAVTGSA